MQQTMKVLPLLAAVLAAACGGGSQSSSARDRDDDGAWMEGATVVVARDASSGRETVTLVDPQSGFSQVVSDEPLTPDVIETDEPSPLVAALASGLSS